MNLTPSSLRLDLKCGKGAISKGEKCTKGPASVVEKVAPIALGLGLAAGAIALRRRGRQQASTAERKVPSIPKDPPKPPPTTPVQRRATEKRPKPVERKVEATPKTKEKVSPVTSQPTNTTISAPKGWRNITTNEKHNYVMGKHPDLNVTLGKSTTPAGNVIDFKLGSSGEVEFRVNGDTNRRQNISREEGATILSRVERMLQASIKDLPNEEVIWTNAYFNDGLGKKRESLYMRYGFQRDPADPTSTELFTTVGELKKRSRRSDALITMRTSTSVRADLKCGKGSISEGEKCSKGPATKVAVGAAVLGLAAGAYAMGRRGRGKPPLSQSKASSAPNDAPKPETRRPEPTRSEAPQRKAKPAPKPQETTSRKYVDPAKQMKINIPESASRPIKQSTNPSRITSASESFYSWGYIPTQGETISLKEAEALIRKKGRILDVHAIPGLDMTQAQSDKIKGRDTEAVQKVRAAYLNFYKADSMDTDRFDLKCGKGAISEGEKCTKGPATKAAIAAGVGLTAGALALGAIALSKRGRARRIGPSGSTSAGSTSPSGPSPTPRLPGSSPRALLKSAPPRQSKTQRMRANTAAAMRNAESRIAQTAREEIRRVGQIGNTMAAAGEATGMAAKTTLRELRLRTEAARRRFEPGYRAPDQRRLPGGSQPPLSNQEEIPSLEQLGQLSTEELQSWVLKDPRTGQPRRRKAQGFGRRDSYIQHYAPVQLQPPTRRDACWEGYEQVGMKRKGKRRVPNCVPVKKRAQADTEDGKKYSKTVTNPKTGRKNKVSYGAKGYTIAPGTDKGDRYCARSFGDMKSHGKDCGGEDRNTPLCLSRAKWKCSGKTSRRS